MKQRLKSRTLGQFLFIKCHQPILSLRILNFFLYFFKSCRVEKQQDIDFSSSGLQLWNTKKQKKSKIPKLVRLHSQFLEDWVSYRPTVIIEIGIFNVLPSYIIIVWIKRYCLLARFMSSSVNLNFKVKHREIE